MLLDIALPAFLVLGLLASVTGFVTLFMDRAAHPAISLSLRKRSFVAGGNAVMLGAGVFAASVALLLMVHRTAQIAATTDVIAGSPSISDSPSLAPTDGQTPTSDRPTSAAQPDSPDELSDVTARVVTPANGAKVSSSDGVTVSGTATPRPGRTLWLFTRSQNENDVSGYYLSSDEIRVDNGQWSQHVGPIGAGEADINTSFPIALVEADAGCSNELKRHEKDTGDIFFVDLPVGCEVKASVMVVVSSA